MEPPLSESAAKKVSQKGKSPEKFVRIQANLRRDLRRSRGDSGEKPGFGISKALLSTSQPPHQSACYVRLAMRRRPCLVPLGSRNLGRGIDLSPVTAVSSRGFPLAASKFTVLWNPDSRRWSLQKPNRGAAYCGVATGVAAGVLGVTYFSRTGETASAQIW